MSDKSLVYEAAQMMQDTDAIQQDMAEAMGLVRNMFQEKYMSRLQNAVRNHQMRIQSSPPKEVQLLESMKLFMPEEKHQPVNNMIDVLLMMSTASSIRGEMQPDYGLAAASVETGIKEDDSSIHPDGIYDMDTTCMASKKNPHSNMANVFLMMTLMGMM